jgi:radical SAM superfamily enzyme YgiQ (UPF0313 family)
MRLILINTPIEQADILGEFSSMYDDLKMIPSGLAYLAANARNHGIEVDIIDQYAECLSIDALTKRIEQFAPDMIGYGATTPNYKASLDILKRLKKVFPNVKSIMGGNHPTILPDDVLSNVEVDYVMRGECDHALPKLCLAIDNGDDLSEVEGLSYRDADGNIKHNPRPPAVELDSIPWPAYDLLPMDSYSSPTYTKFAHPVFQMITSRGCPNKCAYCVNAIESKKVMPYRRRPVDDVIDEIEMLVTKYGARQVQFWDPIFPLGKKYAMEFCEKLIARGLSKKMVWNSTTYAQFLDEEMIDAMYKSGCRGIGFGIESGVPELLHSVNKKADLEKVREICKAACRAGIVVSGFFIFGFPGETPEMTRQTIDYAKSLDIHFAQFSILVPYPGTPLYKQLLENGEFQACSDEEMFRFNQSIGLTGNDLIYVPKGRTSEELKEWQKTAYREFYMRFKMVRLHLPHLRLRKIPQIIKSALAVLKLFGENLFGGRSDVKSDAALEPAVDG